MDALHGAPALAEVRALFAERDFTEVETPLLVRAPGLDSISTPSPWAMAG